MFFDHIYKPFSHELFPETLQYVPFQDHALFIKPTESN